MSVTLYSIKKVILLNGRSTVAVIELKIRRHGTNGI